MQCYEQRLLHRYFYKRLLTVKPDFDYEEAHLCDLLDSHGLTTIDAVTALKLDTLRSIARDKPVERLAA